jgi:hypothetical protein
MYGITSATEWNSHPTALAVGRHGLLEGKTAIELLENSKNI